MMDLDYSSRAVRPKNILCQTVDPATLGGSHSRGDLFMPTHPRPDDADILLTRKEASRELAALGIRRSPGTLAKIYSTGANGPPCVHLGRTPYYPRSLLHAWVRRQLTAPRASSREPRRPGGWPVAPTS